MFLLEFTCPGCVGKFNIIYLKFRLNLNFADTADEKSTQLVQ